MERSAPRECGLNLKGGHRIGVAPDVKALRASGPWSLRIASRAMLRGLVGEVDRLTQRYRFMMKQTVNQEAGDTDVRLEEDQPPGRGEDAACCRRPFEVMEHVKSNRIRCLVWMATISSLPAARLTTNPEASGYLTLDQAPVVFQLPDFGDSSVETSTVGSSP
jgi:hypothetical protein